MLSVERTRERDAKCGENQRKMLNEIRTRKK